MAATIVGRGAELDAVDDVLDAATNGLAGVVFEGEAGIGKTTVWREGVARARARGYEVLACRAAAAEARLSYSALADLLSPVDETAFSILPTPQRRALDVALLRADGTGVVSGRRAVGAAVLSILEHLAGEEPVALAVDDVQWLDGSTARVLEFAIRRLEERSVALLLTRRTGSSTEPSEILSSVPDERLRRSTLGPLNLAALHTIVKGELGEAIPRPLLGRIERASNGNSRPSSSLGRSSRTAASPTVTFRCRTTFARCSCRESAAFLHRRATPCSSGRRPTSARAARRRRGRQIRNRLPQDERESAAGSDSSQSSAVGMSGR